MSRYRKSLAATIALLAYMQAGDVSAASPIVLKFRGFVEHGFNYTGQPGLPLGSIVNIRVFLNAQAVANGKVQDSNTEASYNGGGCNYSQYGNVPSPVTVVIISGYKIEPCYNDVFINKGYNGQTQIVIEGYSPQSAGQFQLTFTSSNTKLLNSTLLPTSIDTTKFDTAIFQAEYLKPGPTYFSGALTSHP